MTIDPDRLDELLAREPYLEDDGFTSRVMERIPARQDRRAVVLWLSGAAAAVTAALVLPTAVQAGLAALAAAALPAALPPGLVVGAAAALVAAGVAGLVVAVER